MTVTVDTPTSNTEPVDRPDELPTAASRPATDDAATTTEAPTEMSVPARSGQRSDADLLAALDAEVERTGKWPTRHEAMALTGAGTTRATRLLAELGERHGGNPAPAKRGAAKRGSKPAGAGSRSRTRLATDTGRTESPGTSPSEPRTPPAPAPATGAAAPTATTQPVPVSTLHGGRLVAWVGFVFGSITSVAANVLAARIPPVHAPAGWSPSLTAEVGAAVWPLALLLSVEVLSRVRMPSGWYWVLAKVGGAVAVAGGSAVISYGHIHDVLTTWRYSAAGAGVGPLVIDGLMVISGFALLAISRRTPPPGTGTASGDAA